MASVQSAFAVNPDIGYPGQIAEPNSPHRIERGVLNVPTGASRSNPRPGDALFYNTTNDAWEVPESADNRRAVSGILGYRADDIANSSSILQYDDGDEIEIITMGVVWVKVGAATERGNILVFQGDWKFDPLARVTTVATMHDVPIQAYNRDAASDGDIVKAAIGYGRTI